MTGSAENAESRLKASEEEPWLNVGAVSQHLFCHRAGVVAHESNEDDTGFEGRKIRLGYLPRYDVREIESMIGRCITASVIGSVAGLLAVALLSAAAWLFEPRLLAAAVVVLILMVVGAVVSLSVILVLVLRLTGAKRAPPDEPEFSNNTAVLVSWWGLHAAGFESQSWPGALHSEAWRVSGKPWGVLARGRERIPVFFDTSDRDRLEKKHYARIAAYCALLESEAQFESPFGVILRPGRSEVEAIPNTPEAVRALADGVEQLRESLHVVTGNYRSIANAHPSFCADCPFGELAAIEHLPSAPNGEVRVHVKTKRGQKNSLCGIRFGWTPPHATAILHSSS